MPSTKRHFTVLACALVLSLCGTLAAANGHEEGHDKTLRTTFSGDFWMMNPCPGADPSFFLLKDGTNMGVFRQDKNHASVHLRYLVKGSDSVGQPVKGFLHARGKVDPVKNLSSLTPDSAVNYDIPFESIWVDNNGAQSWKFSGHMILYVDKTGIFANSLDLNQDLNIQCTDRMDANTPDHRFHNDNDEDDDRDK